MSTTTRDPHPARAPARWLYWFLLFQFACQSAMILAPVGGLRVGFRAAAYLSSAALLVLLPPGGRPHPVRWLTIGVVAVTALGLLHPSLNSIFAGLGQLGMTLAVWSPVFWVGRIRLTPESLRRALLLVWGFNTLSAGVGVLQVYYPDRFAPDTAFTRQLLGDAADGLMVTLDDGRQVYRPMGLSDTPGGAAASGSIAILTGLGLLWTMPGRFLKLMTIPAAAIGMFCIYLCQVRSVLVVTAASLLGIVALHLARGYTGRAVMLATATAAVILGSFVWAATVGEKAVTERLSTLAEGSPVATYYANRGFFLETTLTQTLPEFPVGAGLGRWGMMHAYFGDPQNPDSPPLFSEIQATAWVLDGGLPLLLLGYTAVIGAVVLAVVLATRAHQLEDADTAAVVASLGLGALVTTFGYPVFVSQSGLMFWVLNAALFAALGGRGRRP
jgi:hypothetical protein